MGIRNHVSSPPGYFCISSPQNKELHMMFVLTPTMLGSLLAGAVFYALLWVALHKVAEIPYVREFVTSNQCLSWIKKHQGTTLLMTEGVSALLHGIASPAAVFFNLGGTALNVAVLYGYLPGRDIVSQISAKIRRSA
jgi:hypothetical protein